MCVYKRCDYMFIIIQSFLQVITAILKDWTSSKEDLGIGVVCVAKQQFDTYLTKHHQLSPSPLAISNSHMDVGDFECILCTRYNCYFLNIYDYFSFLFLLSLLYKPVTVPCGHTFCQGCLARTFDHTPYCPMCRSPLGEVRKEGYL